MRFKKISGEGPSQGWISITIKGNSAIKEVFPEPAPSQEKSFPCPQLREIDITYCRKTTYVMTLALRRLLPSLECIRRIPSWTIGDFHTPFAGPGKPVEVHRYWADGSFKFGRGEQSHGFIIEGREYQTGFNSTSCQYVDFNTQNQWDPWAEFCFRPGVTILRADPSDGGDPPKGVLVFQSCDGMYAPSKIPPNAIQIAPRPGKGIVVDRNGFEVNSNPRWGAEENPLGDPVMKGCLLLSHMPIGPLPAGEMMPPPDVVRRTTRFLIENEWPTLDQVKMEHEVHKVFGGNHGDEVAWLA